jgi:hypothetical protein
MIAIAKRLGTLMLLAVVASCVPRAPAPELPVGKFPTDFPSSFYSTVPRESVFRIVQARSTLTIKVFRSGALAKLGHNHVIVSHEVDGFIYLADDFEKARADLFVPVAEFVVDDQPARAAAGPDFASQPTPSDIEGTRSNMLGSNLLDAGEWPFIEVQVTPLNMGSDSTRVQLSIKTRGHIATVPVEAHWKRNGSELSIQATFVTDHAALGLTPFSTLGGALRVADQIDISVSINARTAD